MADKQTGELLVDSLNDRKDDEQPVKRNQRALTITQRGCDLLHRVATESLAFWYSQHPRDRGIDTDQ